MHSIHDSPGLARLYDRRVFQSDVRVDSHYHVATELSDHDLCWKRGKVDTALFKASFRQLQLFILKYGAEVEVRPRPFQDFVLVHVSLRGTAEIESDGSIVQITQGRAALICPRRSIRLNWQEGSEQLIVKIPKLLIAHAMNGTEKTQFHLVPAFLFPKSTFIQWDLLLRSLLNELCLSEGSLPCSPWVEHLERSIALFLLLHQDGASARPMNTVGAHAELHPPADLSDESAMRRLSALEDFIRGRIYAQLSLADLARAASVSVRTLNSLCLRHRGVTPMALLRDMRLDAVHTRLTSEADTNVTQAALDHGFGHLGRFSSYYRERFGELPRQTSGRRS